MSAFLPYSYTVIAGLWRPGKVKQKSEATPGFPFCAKCTALLLPICLLRALGAAASPQLLLGSPAEDTAEGAWPLPQGQHVSVLEGSLMTGAAPTGSSGNMAHVA